MTNAQGWGDLGGKSKTEQPGLSFHERNVGRAHIWVEEIYLWQGKLGFMGWEVGIDRRVRRGEAWSQKTKASRQGSVLANEIWGASV